MLGNQEHLISNLLPKLKLGDPILVLWWNRDRLDEFQGQGRDAQQLIVEVIVDSGGASELDAPNEIFVFKEFAKVVQCRNALKQQLPWVFAVGPETAMILGIQAQEPVATAVLVMRTERVKPDISAYDLFLLN